MQTLVLCVIMALIAAMTLKWVLARYYVSNRAYKSNLAYAHTSGFFTYNQSRWATITPPSLNTTTLDNQSVTLRCVSNCVGAGKKTYQITTDPDI